MDMRVYFEGGAKVSADYKGFIVRTDQPVQSGGENTAPSPFDLFLVSIGTCAGIYVLRFMEQRRLQTQGVEILLTMERNPETHLVTKITTKVVLPDGFPEKYITALINAVNLCTVKKHLLNPPELRTVIEVAGKMVEES